MVAQLIILGLMLQAAQSPPAATPVAPQTTTAAKEASPEADDPSALLKVKRIYVDSFGDDIISKELQSMVVSSLVASKRFKVTENRERADAVLKGVALEKTSQELHATSESTSVGTAAGGANSDVATFGAARAGIGDSSLHTQTINEARIAIRLVSPVGDVIWTTTQESKGAKYKGASADVADMCVKQLLRDVSKLEGSTATSPAPAPPPPDSQHQ